MRTTLSLLADVSWYAMSALALLAADPRDHPWFEHFSAGSSALVLGGVLCFWALAMAGALRRLEERVDRLEKRTYGQGVVTKVAPPSSREHGAEGHNTDD